MILITLIILNFLIVYVQNKDNLGFCDINKNTCERSPSATEKYLFYDINLAEGFNLRRDVYMRFAVMLAEGKNSGKWENWGLILPPWYGLYHWKSDTSRKKPLPWGHFFDVDALKAYAPVRELYEIFTKTTSQTLEIDTLYVLENFDDPYFDTTFTEKWEINKKYCNYNNKFWGYKNITAKEIICVKFQGKISKLYELISLHPRDKFVMFSHAEVPLHDFYGTKEYWDCRKSMKFNKKLVRVAEKFISKHLDCDLDKCTSYISVHWRRQDFAHSRHNDVPSLSGTVKEIERALLNNKLKVTNIFIASDATEFEMEQLKVNLEKLKLVVHFFIPTKKELDLYKDGGIAIIEQIICSHAIYFIGTHESTFTFRIQEEREILGFDSDTTFNRLCPDTGPCSRPSRWTIIN